jgi:glyoxylase-like metal-dependent hydrolase (beta-lactamase superfamily II)
VLIFEQLFDPETSTYTYLIGDGDAGVAALCDPVLEQLDRDLAKLDEHRLRLIHTLETHLHADHVTAGNALAERCGSRPIVHQSSPISCDAVRVRQDDVFTIGAWRVGVLETPGHTPESVSFLLDGIAPRRVLTGDALLVGTCGRTDFQGGDPGVLWDTVHGRLFTLPDDTLVFPGHDYQGQFSSTIGAERSGNQRLCRTRDAFITLMNTLALPRPRKMDEALPANLACGKSPPRQA